MTVLLNPVFLLIIGSFVLVVVSLYCTRNRATRDEELQLGRLEQDERSYRMEELRVAYTFAKVELGEEPTVDQILLTRDTLRGEDDGED